MGSHPVNLAVRFLLELIALSAIGVWGWQQSNNWMRFFLALGLPLLVAAAWGIFAVPGDPSRSGNAPFAIHGALRLAMELVIFAFATWALQDGGHTRLGWFLGVTTCIHYLASYDRIQWLLSQ